MATPGGDEVQSQGMLVVDPDAEDPMVTPAPRLTIGQVLDSLPKLKNGS